jgi:predicted ABC-type ATPase
LENPDLWQRFSVQENQLIVDEKQKINSYIAADLAEFIRQRLLKAGSSFSYETVMSDEQKIVFLEKAKKEGYRIYLYYFATEDPRINISRVEIRVAQNGHPVKKESIKKRYYKSLENLKSAVMLSDRTYLFDNSQRLSRLISEITEGKKIYVIDPENTPSWFAKYIVDKK